MEAGDVERLRRSGSPGTHNGMRNVVACLGTNDFPRLRIGIGQPPPRADVADYVLDPFPPGEREEAELSFDRAADAIESLIQRGWLRLTRQIGWWRMGRGGRWPWLAASLSLVS